MEKKVILFDAPEAARKETFEGWRSADGFLFFDERTARYSGCTHKKCESCPETIEKHFIRCRTCQKKLDDKKYSEMPRKKWDGLAVLSCFRGDEYFVSIEDAQEYADDREMKIEDLQLVICEPIQYSEVEPYEHYSNDLPEDGEICAEILQAFERLNRAIRQCKEPISWLPGKFALELKK